MRYARVILWQITLDVVEDLRRAMTQPSRRARRQDDLAALWTRLAVLRDTLAAEKLSSEQLDGLDPAPEVAVLLARLIARSPRPVELRCLRDLEQTLEAISVLEAPGDEHRAIAHLVNFAQLVEADHAVGRDSVTSQLARLPVTTSLADLHRQFAPRGPEITVHHPLGPVVVIALRLVQPVLRDVLAAEAAQLGQTSSELERLGMVCGRLARRDPFGDEGALDLADMLYLRLSRTATQPWGATRRLALLFDGTRVTMTTAQDALVEGLLLAAQCAFHDTNRIDARTLAEFTEMAGSKLVPLAASVRDLGHIRDSLCVLLASRWPRHITPDQLAAIAASSRKLDAEPVGATAT